jgi:hypothetical protein
MAGLLTKRREIFRTINPDSINSLAGWWSAMKTTHVNGVVNSVLDISGNAIHMNIVSGSPTLIDSGLNGRPVVNFTASPAQYIETGTRSAEAFFGANRNSVTIFALWKYTAGTIAYRLYDNSNNNRVDRVLSSNTTNIWNGSSYTVPNYSSSTAFRLQIQRFDGDSGRYDAWDGLTKVASQIDFTGRSMASSNNYKFRFGNEAAAADEQFAEGGVYSRAIADNEVEWLARGLLKSWGML